MKKSTPPTAAENKKHLNQIVKAAKGAKGKIKKKVSVMWLGTPKRGQ
jgi:hypothetical protein